ncbi:GNAT family N-acetyltransferase [Serratia grimesii]|uniref:GNAT family N-acetyltransferase n=1 Tax=Serratia grimesii TaxID=82995 RepID=UPI00164872BE|nr:GNAT family N-acetyltransferase [Serratia grimesii]
MIVRLATIADISVLTALDTVVSHGPHRCAQIREWCAAGICYLAESRGQVMAYGVLNAHFFGCGFIEMLMVAEGSRRQGVGLKLLHTLISLCPEPKLFTSTNRSNVPMRRLLLAAGFIESGHIENLDEGGPEVIYFYPNKCARN